MDRQRFVSSTFCRRNKCSLFVVTVGSVCAWRHHVRVVAAHKARHEQVVKDWKHIKGVSHDREEAHQALKGLLASVK